MATIAQTALSEFQAEWLNLQWTAMSDAQRNTYLRNYLGLQIAAAKEIEANRIEEESNQQTAAETRKQQLIEYLTNQGFACDNSEQDWNRLYDRTEIYGIHWHAQSEYQRSLSIGVDYFLNHAYQLWNDLQNS